MGKVSKISVVFGLALFGFVPGPIALADNCEHNLDHFSCVEYVRNYDGDSITFDIPSVHPIFGSEIAVRVYGIDSPEMSSDDECEVKMAQKAQAEVEKLLLKARRVDLLNPQRGKYFRVVADVLVDGKSVSEHMLRKKLAVEYYGGTKERVNWCRR